MRALPTPLSAQCCASTARSATCCTHQSTSGTDRSKIGRNRLAAASTASKSRAGAATELAYTKQVDAVAEVCMAQLASVHHARNILQHKHRRPRQHRGCQDHAYAVNTHMLLDLLRARLKEVHHTLRDRAHLGRLGRHLQVQGSRRHALQRSSRHSETVPTCRL